MLKWFTRETRLLYIARPETAAGALIFQHPDRTIPRGAKITVRADECALFFREGIFAGSLEAGTYLLDTLNIPFLGHLLVNPLTGGNHFLSEIYFVSLSEVQVQFERTSLGQCTDLNSRNVVGVQGTMAYTLRVQDPIQLMNNVAGQSAAINDVVRTLANSRVSNVLRSLVGRLAATRPVLDIVSNAESGSIGAEVLKALGPEFEGMGLQLARVLDVQLSLDAGSLQVLQAHGKQEAQLALQQRGAAMAVQPGFAEFNLVQGQRAALEGLGKGLAQGRAGFAMGANFAADLTHVRSPSSAGASVSRSPAVLAGPSLYFVLKNKVEQGPFKIRQVVNVALLNQLTLEQLEVRREDDPAGTYIPASTEPEIAAEYRRRAGA